jgi:hypothetical protein
MDLEGNHCPPSDWESQKYSLLLACESTISLEADDNCMLTIIASRPQRISPTSPLQSTANPETITAFSANDYGNPQSIDGARLQFPQYVD